MKANCAPSKVIDMATITETELYRNMRTYGVTRDQMDKFLSELSEYMPDDSGAVLGPLEEDA